MPPRSSSKAAERSARFIDWGADFGPCPAWPTGNLFLDWLTGIGGLPKGRVVEVYGPESSGKSTLGLQTAAQVWHREGIPSHYADFEDAFDARYAKALGLTPEALKLDEPETLEDYLEGLDADLKSGEPRALTIFDSVAGGRSRADMKGEIADTRTAAMERARIWSNALAVLVKRISERGVTLLLVNQLRDYIDTNAPAWESPAAKAAKPKSTTPGGRGIKFYSSLRIEFTASSDISVVRQNPLTLEDEKVAIGRNVWLRVKKNKVAPPPWRAVRLQIRDGIGFDLSQNLLDFAVTHDYVRKLTQGRHEFPAELFSGGEPWVVGPQEGFTGEQVAVEALRQNDSLREGMVAWAEARLAAVEAGPTTADEAAMEAAMEAAEGVAAAAGVGTEDDDEGDDA